MLEVLQFIFSSAWNFLGTVILLVIMVCWKPIDITILTGKLEHKDDNE